MPGGIWGSDMLLKSGPARDCLLSATQETKRTCTNSAGGCPIS